MVRTGIVNDALYEGPETFQLRATVTDALGADSGFAVNGTATVLDDGTGSVFTSANTSGTPDTPGQNGAPALNDDRSVSINNIEVNEASPFAVFTLTTPVGSAGTYVKLGLQADNDPATADATAGVDMGPQLQIFDGSGWVNYLPGTPVLIPAGGLLVRTAITNDTIYEGPESFQLRATITNQAGSVDAASSLGTATILDDGKGVVFNDSGAIDPLARKDDDRVAPGIDAAQPIVLAPPLPLLPSPPADVHVQVAVAQAYAEQRSAASFSASNAVMRVPAGGQFMVRFAQAQADAFDRPTDPNLFVLPAVQQARFQSLEVQIPTLMMQSGLLQKLGSEGAMGEGLTPRASLDAAPTLADQTLRDLAEAIPEESQSMQSHAVIAELEETEQQLVRKQLAQLEAARLASGDTVNPKGQYGFTQQLKMNAQPRGGTPNPRS